MAQQYNKNVVTFANVCDTIVRGFSLKIELHKRRENLFNQYGNNYESVKGRDDFFTKSKNILDKERRVINALRGDDKNLEAAIEKLIRLLAKFRKETKFPSLRKGYYIVPDEAKGILRSVGMFITRFNRDLSRIEKRILIEEKFLELKDRKSFSEFIKEWNKEYMEHQIMKKHFYALINDVQPYTISVSYKSIGTSLGTIIGMWGTTYGVNQLVGGEFDDIYLFAVCLSILTGLCILLGSLIKEEILEERIDLKEIKEFQQSLR